MPGLGQAAMHLGLAAPETAMQSQCAPSRVLPGRPRAWTEPEVHFPNASPVGTSLETP